MTSDPPTFERAPDFRPASSALPKLDTFHIIVVDWHNLQSPNTVTSVASRLRLRDAFIRFLHTLFDHTHLITQPLMLLATCGHDDQHIARIVQVLEMVSSSHVPIASVMQSLRATQQPCSPLSSSQLRQYSRSLVDQLSEWGASRSAAPHTYIFCNPCVSVAISAALSASPSSIFSSDRSHIFPCQAPSEADGHLSEILARLLESTVTLTLPSDTAAGVNVALNVRPRVLTSTIEYPTALVATKRVGLQSVREDVLHSTPLVVWPKPTTPVHVEHNASFSIVVRKLRQWDEALLCIAIGEDSQKLFVLLPSGNEIRAALLRQVAHAGTLLPVPRCVVRNTAPHAIAHEVAQELALQLLPSTTFHAPSLRIGGVRKRSANAGRRVNFRRE
ncbi:unnamed protein product [Agarophyton chilense]